MSDTKGETKYQDFNVNSYVRVKLTPLGKNLHRDDHYKFWNEARFPKDAIPNYTPPVEDENGWSKWQLWSLMEAFGPHTHLGGENPFETTIQLCTQHADR